MSSFRRFFVVWCVFLLIIRTSSKGLAVRRGMPRAECGAMMTPDSSYSPSSKSSLTRALKALERRKAPQADAVAAFVASSEAAPTAADARMLLHLARRRYSGSAAAHAAAVAESAALVYRLHATPAWDAGICNMLVELVGEHGWVNTADADGYAVSAEQILDSVPPSRMDEKTVALLIRLFGQRGNARAACKAFELRRDVAPVPALRNGRSRGENSIVWNTYLSTLLGLRLRRVGGVEVSRLLRATKAAIAPDAYTASSALQHAASLLTLTLTRRPVAGQRGAHAGAGGDASAQQREEHIT